MPLTDWGVGGSGGMNVQADIYVRSTPVLSTNKRIKELPGSVGQLIGLDSNYKMNFGERRPYVG
jgi:hypothetical protein